MLKLYVLDTETGKLYESYKLSHSRCSECEMKICSKATGEHRMTTGCYMAPFKEVHYDKS